jgi:hypothetical protein
MTEVGWQWSTTPWPMLEFMKGKVSDRKHRLLICGCYRRLGRFMEESRYQNLVRYSESFADGTLSPEDLVPSGHPHDPGGGFHYVAVAAGGPFNVFVFGMDLTHMSGAMAIADAAEHRTHAELTRCVFGNPFRPVTFDPAWRTSTVLSLASQMYESRDFSAIPILADALQDAGCDNADILNHCRDAGQVHVRGCWVVDLVLGKE